MAAGGDAPAACIGKHVGRPTAGSVLTLPAAEVPLGADSLEGVDAALATLSRMHTGRGARGTAALPCCATKSSATRDAPFFAPVLLMTIVRAAVVAASAAASESATSQLRTGPDACSTSSETAPGGRVFPLRTSRIFPLLYKQHEITVARDKTNTRPTLATIPRVKKSYATVGSEAIAWPATVCSGGGRDAEADAELELLADWLADGDADTLE